MSTALTVPGSIVWRGDTPAIACGTIGSDLGSGREGCIAFGLPEDLFADESSRAFAETPVQPGAGLPLLFRSHSDHRTFPHGRNVSRICRAFDFQPG